MSDRTISAPAKKGKRSGTKERRAWVRYPSELEGARCTLASEWGTFWKASVRDLSRSGVGLILDSPFEPGVVLAIELQSPSQDLVRVLVGRVRHVTPMEKNRWLTGCEFLKELTEEELRVLL